MRDSLKYLSAVAFVFMLVVPMVAAASSDHSTVNKSIRIDDNSNTGDVDSVNGSIRIGDNSIVNSVESVNGSINIGDDVSVEQGIEAVNGSIKLGSGCQVADNIETINGSIRIQNTRVSGDITSVNGGIHILKGSEVVGNVVVQKPGGWSWNKRKKPVKVEIGENVQIHGDLIFEHAVELQLHDTAKVGEIIGDEVEIIRNS